MSSVRVVAAVQAAHSETVKSHVPLHDVLTGVGLELRTLATTVERLEELVGSLVIEDAVSRQRSIHELQALDEMRQTLEGLADFVERVGETSVYDQVDVQKAAESLTLAALCRRLVSVTGNVAPVREVTPADSFELFGEYD